eukprot:COSAG05_NODE_1609_length_4412_cov_2.348018_3_plen_358_part_00
MDETCQFSDPNAPAEISIQVWDQDRGSRDDPIGFARLAVSDIVAGKKQWLPLQPMARDGTPLANASGKHHGEICLRCTVTKGRSESTPTPAAVAAAPAPEVVSVTLSEPGPLGLSFGSSTEDGSTGTFIKAVRPNTQAARVMPPLIKGLYIVAIEGTKVVSFKQAMALLKSSPRPITLSFTAQAPTAATSPTASASGGPSPRARRAGEFEVVFVQPGPLGIKFVEVECGSGGAKVVKVLSVNAGTQAEALQVGAGMELLSVQGTAVAGLSYNVVLGMLRTAPRPLTLTFDEAGAAKPGLSAAAPAPAPAPAAAPAPAPAAAPKPAASSKPKLSALFAEVRVSIFDVFVSCTLMSTPL